MHAIIPSIEPGSYDPSISIFKASICGGVHCWEEQTLILADFFPFEVHFLKMPFKWRLVDLVSFSEDDVIACLPDEPQIWGNQLQI